MRATRTLGRRASSSTMRILREDGYVVLSDVVPATTSRQALAEVRTELAALQASWAYPVRRFFDIVDSPRNRHSFPVSLTPGVDAAVRSIVGGTNASLFREICGDDGILVELSALITFPGARAQSLHTDIPFNALPECKETNTPPLCSVFVALQDVDRDMGPTIIFKGTHRKEFHRAIDATQESYDSSGNIEVLTVSTENSDDDNGNDNYSVPPTTFTEDQIFDAALLPCNEGTVYVMDSRCAHAGGANISTTSRAVLCFAFQKDSKPMERARGFTYHIRPDLENKQIRLSAFT